MLSFACETTIEPAPIDWTTRALAIGDSKPKGDIKGLIRDAVVIRATVEEPWAVLMAAATMNGSQMPRFASDRKLLITAAKGEFLRTRPKEPPAPVTIIMIPEPRTAWPTQPVVESICILSFLGRRNAKRTPISNAITGSPIKLTQVFKRPSPSGLVGKSETDFKTIKIMGAKIGMKALKDDGASLSRAVISASERSGSGSI